MKKVDTRGLSAPAPGLYTCIWPPFSKIFLSKTAWPIKAKFHVEPPWEGVKKIYINGPGHRPKWPPCPYMVKTFKNLLLQNRCNSLSCPPGQLAPRGASCPGLSYPPPWLSSPPGGKLSRPVYLAPHPYRGNNLIWFFQFICNILWYLHVFLKL